MRPVVIIEPNEPVDGAPAVVEGPALLQGQALVVDGPKEAFDFAIRLRVAGPDQMMGDAETAARLLEPREPVGVVGMPHGEGERIVGQDGLHAIRELGDDVFEEVGGGHAGLIQGDGDDGFPAEVVDRGEFVVKSGISERGQQFDIDVHELPRPALLVPLHRRAWRAR